MASKYIELHIKGRGTPNRFREEHIVRFSPAGMADAKTGHVWVINKQDPIEVEESYTSISALVDGDE